MSRAWDPYDVGLMLKEVEKRIAKKRAAIISVSSHVAEEVVFGVGDKIRMFENRRLRILSIEASNLKGDLALDIEAG